MAETPKDLVVRKDKSLSIDFSTNDIDLSNLTPEARQEIEQYAARKKVDIRASYAEMQRDLQATSAAMNTSADVVRRMTESGDAVTVKQKIINSAGNIEIIAGNTDEAKKGQISSIGDIPWPYIIGGIILAVIAALIMSNK